MSYRIPPTEPVTICDVTSSVNLHVLNGTVAEFLIPCLYVVPVEGTDVPELRPIHLADEGYGDPDFAIDTIPDGLTWSAWIDAEDDSLIRFTISAQCPDAVTESVLCNVSLLITRTEPGLGVRTDSVIRGPLLIVASPYIPVGEVEL